MKWTVWATLTAVALTVAPVAVTVAPLAQAATVSQQTILRQGDHGSAVVVLQQDLNRDGYSCGAVDGDFGPSTLAAVKKFQQVQHLMVDGIVGPATWAALGAVGQQTSGKTAKATSSSSSGAQSSVSGGGNPVQANGATQTREPTARSVVLAQKEVYFDGQMVYRPAGFVSGGTTYVPVWYLQQVLKRLGIECQWNGTVWNILTQPGDSPDLSQLPPLAKGKYEIQINNTPVNRVDGFVYGHPATTYMPAWYIMQVLNRLHVVNQWDGTTWQVYSHSEYQVYDKAGTQQPSLFAQLSRAEQAALSFPGGSVKDLTGKLVFQVPDFTDYRKDGTLIPGDFSSQAAAQAALAQVPAGIVKNAQGQVVFTQGDYGVYPGPQQTPQEFAQSATALTTAAQLNAAGGNAYVVNLSANLVVQDPPNYDYVNPSGGWSSSQSGVLSQSPPSFAQPGMKYIQISGATSGQIQYFALSNQNGTYLGTPVNSGENPFQTVDLRFPAPASVTAGQIDQWLAQNQSPLQGLGSSFMNAQQLYGVDATYLLAHAIWETGWGNSSIYQAKNNLFGFGAYDTNPANYAGSFPTSDYSIRWVAWFVRQQYLSRNGNFYVSANGPTLDGMGVHYATDPHWPAGIASVMTQYVTDNQSSVSDYTQYRTGDFPPKPNSNTMPVYFTGGAKGTIQAGSLSSLPLYAQPSQGYNTMYPGPLQINSSGSAVKELQSQLNASPLQPGLLVDGQFGPMTETAVKAWQTANNLPATGVCDATMWSRLFAPSQGLPTGTQVTIDQVQQGWMGNTVSQWDHVVASTGLSGWVDAMYVAPQVQSGGQAFTNWFRVNALSGYNVNVYEAASSTAPVVATLHQGDDVVTAQTYPASAFPAGQNFIAVQIANQQTGSISTGYIASTQATLQPLASPVSPS